MTASRYFRSSVLPPNERGREFGRVHGPGIARTVAGYQRLFDQAAREAVDLTGWGEEAMGQITAAAPALAQEIEGLAAGANLPVAHVAAINARTEMLAWAHRRGGTPAPHECTTAVKLTVDGTPPVAVQTWDWYPELADSWLVWEIPHPDGRVTTTLTEYGIVGKIGVNRSRLGLLLNILHTDGDGHSIGTPLHVLARRVLDEATDLNQALLILTHASVSASSCLTVIAGGPEENAAVSLELSPDHVGFVLPDDLGLLVHSNHFLDPPAPLIDTELRTGPDTLLRLNLLSRRLRGRPVLTVADVIGAMDTHLFGAGSMCCHPDPAEHAEAQFATLATVELDVAAGTVTTVPDGPCTHPLLHPVAKPTKQGEAR